MMGKVKALDIERQEQGLEFDEYEFAMHEMWEQGVIAGAVELCKRKDYGYSKFLDELHKALNESRGNTT
jgi:hypothetical protein